MTIYQKNLYYAQKLQQRSHGKNRKLRNYFLGNKVWLSSKYIKTKRNQKPETKLFDPFQVLYLVKNQAYKLQLLKKWSIYNVFHVSLLKKDIIKKGQVDDDITQMEFKYNDNNKYEVQGI